MMNKQNSLLLIVIILLALANAVVFFTGRWTNAIARETEIFAVADTASIMTLTITGQDKSIAIRRTPNGWSLNDQYMVNEGMRRLLFSIMERVRVRKPVEEPPVDSLEVTITGSEETSFLVYSNLTKTKTYFHDSETGSSYEVEIPGYHEYLGAIFELSFNQWRDRMIMDENWRSIKSLVLDYTEPGRRDIRVDFDQNFFRVDGVNRLDSTLLIDYLNQFQVFEVNEIISADQFPKYDSLSRTTPVARLEINSIRSRDPRKLSIFPKLGKEQFQLVQDQSGQLMVIDTRRLNQILIEQLDFQAKD